MDIVCISVHYIIFPFYYSFLVFFLLISEILFDIFFKYKENQEVYNSTREESMNKKQRTTYHEEISLHYFEKIQIILNELPSYVKQYFRAIEPRTSIKTRLSYAYDLKVFFRFIKEKNPIFQNKDLKEISLHSLEELNSDDIEEYLEYLKHYEDKETGKIYHNSERGLHRKLASLRSFFHYFYRTKKIKSNPAAIVDMPKVHTKEIIRLEPDEVADLLDLVEHGAKNLSPQKQRYFEKNKIRNLAIFTLLLGTGIRISECIGLDLEDVDFKNSRIKIIRKGGKEDFVYFGNEVETALADYIKIRDNIHPIPGHEHALFLSTQKRRLSVSALENLVNEYASQITTVKHITPHKLRSTYGTELYRQTSDIYLVAEVLGHNDVNTTKKHYAALEDDRKRHAANKVSLRKEQ